MGIMLITLATFLTVMLVVLATYSAVTAESPVERRLKKLVPQAAIGTAADEQPRSGPRAVERVLAGLGRGIGGEGSLSRTLSTAGLRGPNATFVFVGIRTLLSFGPALFILVPRVSQGQPLGRSLLVAAFVGAFGHALANLWLRSMAQRRMRKLTDALPDSLDLMVTCLESGLGLNATIARIGEERS